jgi:hypothetical protein
MLTHSAQIQNQTIDSLKDECDFFYFLMFNRQASASVVENYLNAHQQLAALIPSGESEQATINKIVQARLNAISIEPLLRLRKKNHLLTKKIAFLSYIAEADATHSEFSRHSIYRFPLLFLIWQGCTAVASIIYGIYLVKRHGLV